MKLKLIFPFIILSQFLCAQTFTEVFRATEFIGVNESSIAFADIDGDGDNDVLITGAVNSGAAETKLYTNEGSGRFYEVMNTPFDIARDGSIAFADIDGDGDSDVLITGISNSSGVISKLYTNDGSGNFTEVMDTPFEGVYRSSIAFSDVDGDGDSDVLITGRRSSSKSSKLYLNNGLGSFTEVTGTPFKAVSFSSIAFSDVDGDGDSDVLITGRNNSEIPISILYLNDGLGNFSEVIDTFFDGVRLSSIAFSDVDGDGDSDVLITGQNNSSDPIAKLYTNDGMGSFTEVMDTPFEGVILGSIAFSDVDEDGDSDVLITGSNNSSDPIAKLYTNNGSGTFTEKIGTIFNPVKNSSIAFSDVDEDGDSDVLITGNDVGRFSTLYYNDGSGNFSILKGLNFEEVDSGSIAFSDVDGDGDSDVLITGMDTSFDFISKLYTNDGSGTFCEVEGTPFDGVTNSSIAFADVDGDEDSDVLITGSSVSGRISKLYLNDGSGTFIEMIDTPFEAVNNSSIAFADVDGDGDSDVLITGAIGFTSEISKLYINDGSGNFTELMPPPFDGVTNSSIAFSDVDGDGDSDVLITGLSNFERISKLYTNDGSGSFTEVMGTPFDGVFNSSVAFADVDGDMDNDVLITGQVNSIGRISKLYTNDGSGNFTQVFGTPFDPVGIGSIAFVDVDGDEDSDVLITGENNSFGRISKLYTNNGLGNFNEVMETPFDPVLESSVAFEDIDGDGDSDVLITGQNISLEPISKLYINESLITSTNELTNKFSLNFIAYPNPITSNSVYLNYDTPENGEITIRLYDLNGILLRQQKEPTVIGQQTFEVNIESMAPGSYFIELNKGKERGIRKFIIH